MRIQAKSKYTYNKKKFKNPFKKKWDGLPATVRQSLFEKTLTESFFASIFCHILGLLLIWGLVSAIFFFGIAPIIFPQPKAKMNDIEFVLNNGKRHRIHSRKAHLQQQVTLPDDIVTPTQTPRVESPKSTNKSSNRVQKVTKSKSGVPDFALPMPSLKSMTSGLSNGSGKSKRHASGVESINSSSLGSSASDGTSAAGTSGFDRNSTKKIIASYDISPYVRELKRNIRWNWKPPGGNENKRVELFLRIAKDGRLVILNVKRTSEVGDVDNAALNAVKKCLPLNPLPSKYPKGYLDVVFTFDSNSVGSRF